MSSRGQLPGFIAAGHYRIGRFEIVKLIAPESNSQRVARWEVRINGKPLMVEGRPLRRHTAHDAIKYAQEAEHAEHWLTGNPVIGCIACEAIDPGAWRERRASRAGGAEYGKAR